MQQIVKSRDIYSNEYDVLIDELTWRPAAYAIIVRGDNILLVHESGGFHMPGGGVNLGEMPEDAAVRETKEETGLDISNPQLVGTLSTFFTHAHRKSQEKPTHVQSLLLYYLCDVAEGEVSLDGLEEDEREYGLTAEWIAIKDLDTITVGSTVDWRPIVKRALENR
jgi:8-oxo-dGTP diphosphatase